MFKKCIFFLCLLSIFLATPVPDSQTVDTVAEKILPETDKSNDQSSDLETAEFKHFGKRKFGFGVPVAVPVAAPVYVQPVAFQPVHYQQPVHFHTPDCGCNNGGYGGYNGGQSYGYNYNYHYNY